MGRRTRTARLEDLEDARLALLQLHAVEHEQRHGLVRRRDVAAVQAWHARRQEDLPRGGRVGAERAVGRRRELGQRARERRHVHEIREDRPDEPFLARAASLPRDGRRCAGHGPRAGEEALEPFEDPFGRAHAAQREGQALGRHREQRLVRELVWQRVGGAAPQRDRRLRDGDARRTDPRLARLVALVHRDDDVRVQIKDVVGRARAGDGPRRFARLLGEPLVDRGDRSVLEPGRLVQAPPAQALRQAPECGCSHLLGQL